MFRKILVGVLLVLTGIQFFRPSRNHSDDRTREISTVYQMPNEVEIIFKTKCYDCHSNNTEYPWYFNVQPVAWFLADHIDHGKRHLNLSEFATYTDDQKKHKLKEIFEQVNEGTMPLESYTWMHPDSKLSDQDKKIVLEWIRALR